MAKEVLLGATSSEECGLPTLSHSLQVAMQIVVELGPRAFYFNSGNKRHLYRRKDALIQHHQIKRHKCCWNWSNGSCATK